MKIRVLFFGALADRLGERSFELEVPVGATAGDAVEALAQRFTKLGDWRSKLALAVNLGYVKADRVLVENDELALIPPVSGG